MYTEIQYLNIVSHRLEKFKKKGQQLWNFRCPICGDSKNNKNKARGFVYNYKNTMMYKCHNCNVTLPFSKFLETIDGELYKEYVFQKFQDNNVSKAKINKKKVNKIISEKPKFSRDPFVDIERVEDLNTTHPAKQYLASRKLPLKGLCYTDQFKKWTNTLVPNKFKDVSRDEARIIIPLIDRNNHIFGYQGRILSPDSSAKYITILLDEGYQKVFGMNTVDPSKTVYVVEGPFDSMLLSNSIAMAGASISEVPELQDSTVVYVYDNQPRNSAVCKQIKMHIDSGHSVVIWPDSIKEKDINDMYLAGHDVNKLVLDNTYNGLNATLKFTTWRK